MERFNADKRLINFQNRNDSRINFKIQNVFLTFRYERLLRRAKTEDLSEISGIGCLYQSGYDRYGRPVIVFVGKWFRFKEINLDKVSLSLFYFYFVVVSYV